MWYSVHWTVSKQSRLYILHSSILVSALNNRQTIPLWHGFGKKIIIIIQTNHFMFSDSLFVPINFSICIFRSPAYFYTLDCSQGSLRQYIGMIAIECLMMQHLIYRAEDQKCRGKMKWRKNRKWTSMRSIKSIEVWNVSVGFTFFLFVFSFFFAFILSSSFFQWS